jgi:hypothetical protein
MAFMKNMAALRVSALLILVIQILFGCGGGGGGGPTDTSGTAEGLWVGTNSDSRNVSGLVFGDGSYWFLYSAVGNPDIVTGLALGNGISKNNEFTSDNAVIFNTEIPDSTDATISANYSQKQTFDGSVSEVVGSGVTTFNLDYDTAYEGVPSLASIAGSYSGQSTYLFIGNSTGMNVSISSDGTLRTYSIVSCQGDGTVTPRSDGNAYDVSIKFTTIDSGICYVLEDATFNGIAYLAADGVTLYLATVNTNGKPYSGFIFQGRK